MEVKIELNGIQNLRTSTKPVTRDKESEEQELVTTFSFDVVSAAPISVARILNIQRQNAPINVTIGSPQGVMDLGLSGALDGTEKAE